VKLGRLIEKLEKCDSSLPVRFRRLHDEAETPEGSSPRGFDSYRGYYNRLMLCWDEQLRTVAELLTEARHADGATFMGYKGGDFLMDRQTKVHPALYGDTSDDEIIDVRQRVDEVSILVAHVDEEW
jgi:hypothetical protein